MKVLRAYSSREDLAALAEEGLRQIGEGRFDARLEDQVGTVLHWCIVPGRKSCEARAIVVRRP